MFADDKEMVDGEKKRVKKRGISTLKKAIKEYNVAFPNEWGTGGSNYVGELLDIKGLPTLEKLCTCINNLTDPIPVALYERIVVLLGGATLSKGSDATRIKAAIDYINGFSYCQQLIQKKFPDINRFALELYIPRQKTPYSSIEAFLKSNQTLKRCVVRLESQLLRPKAKATTGIEPPEKTSTGIEVKSDTKSTEPPTEVLERVDRCLAHHLNFERQLVLADTTLTWSGSTLTRVVMVQRDEFRIRAGRNTFVGEGPNIISEGRTIYIVLKAEGNPDIQLQVTIERQPDELGQRNGVFTYMKYKLDAPQQPAVPFSGLVVLQNVPEKLDIQLFEQELLRAAASDSKRNKPKNDLLRDALRIRYRILDQIATFPKSLAKAETAPWAGLQDFVGRYVCYYMRLSFVPARFEISQIEIFADGRASLRQPPNEARFEGYVRVNANRLWIYFRPNYDEVTGKEPIRFIVDKGMTRESMVFRGMFSSQTMTEKKLVSGRMLMKRLLPREAWPKPLSVPFDQINLSHLPDAEDRTFFMEEWKPEANLTDGPIWAEVANRLQKHSALPVLNQLCTDSSRGKKAFNRRHFYYYSFKNESDEEDQFFIQRDLLTFYENGTVTIQAGNTTYKGVAFYHQQTLRLSLSSDEHGFLEIFLSVMADKSDLHSIEILYGQSLWRNGARIQGKNVVLSRLERQTFSPKQENFYFLHPNDKRFKAELKRLTDEDTNGGGVISYQRGEANRFMHTTAGASHRQFRPRDQRFREAHFLIACYYGFLFHQGWPTAILPGTDAYTQWLRNCENHLKFAFTHGYACNFAGICLSLDGEVPPFATVESIYHDRFKNARRNHRKTTDIIHRIRQIAAEQRFLRKAFALGGPLALDVLYEFASHYWPNLLPSRK
ncbi:hypothetical protein [Rudanella paleaurantiibacter]|nr:hypothetical protein [Rudanella paleaurantiibacter]